MIRNGAVAWDAAVPDAQPGDHVHPEGARRHWMGPGRARAAVTDAPV